ncbi:5116_t:CDS:2, partial [Entrophospora sp. SA101]
SGVDGLEFDAQQPGCHKLINKSRPPHLLNDQILKCDFETTIETQKKDRNIVQGLKLVEIDGWLRRSGK